MITTINKAVEAIKSGVCATVAIDGPAILSNCIDANYKNDILTVVFDNGMIFSFPYEAIASVKLTADRLRIEVFPF